MINLNPLSMALNRQNFAVSFCLPCIKVLIHPMLIIKLCPALPGTRCFSESTSHSFKGKLTTIRALKRHCSLGFAAGDGQVRTRDLTVSN